jgi:hypothetical protein
MLKEIKQKEEPPELAAHFFDNPKTNLTYEKNLCLLNFKYRAKHYTNISRSVNTKKYFASLSP